MSGGPTGSGGDLLLSVAIPRPLGGLFTYRLPERLQAGLQVGGWVRVPFGRTKTHAFVVEAPKPLAELSPELKPESLKDIIEIGPQGKIFPDEVLKLAQWAADYYRSPIGEVLNAAAPSAVLGLKTKKMEAREFAQVETAGDPLPPLNADQVRAVETILGGGPPATLLRGVTGSGKTRVYIEVAQRMLAQGRGVVILVPEIALTSQLHAEFARCLGEKVAVWHSAVADGRRRDEAAALLSGKIRVVVGARSAVFAPVQNLGLIVIDEEHDATYKQEDRVRYHARDLALVRARFAGARVILGSATPSLESLERAREGKYGLAELPKRISEAGMPTIELVDLCEAERVEGARSVLTVRAQELLRDTLAAGEQAILFLNRRGFASFLVCQDCGESAECPDCSVTLTVHRARGKLACHTCGFEAPIHSACGKCQGGNLDMIGSGTEGLEDDIQMLFPADGLGPEAKIARLDRDVITSVKRLEETLHSFKRGDANILLGTQMLVKGHDFPNVTLVLVILADALFRWPDFRAGERAYQVLKQVSGRAGRGDRPGRVLIQAFDLDHPVLRVLMGELPEAEWLESERVARRELRYPPFGRLARLRFEGASRDEVIEAAERLARGLESAHQGVDVLGPSEALVEKVKSLYRWDILLRAEKVDLLQRAVGQAMAIKVRPSLSLSVDVDPYSAG